MYFYRTERKKYHHHREKARANPTKCFTVIIDGMDQAKTNLPNTKIIAKSTSALWRLRTHVTGILVHTKAPFGKLAFAFVDLLQWPHDSNLTITLLMNVFQEFQKTYPLPSTLYLQMDNTARENKNKYVLGFCAALVELRIFEKVAINILLEVCFHSLCPDRFRLTSFLWAIPMRTLINFSLK